MCVSVCECCRAVQPALVPEDAAFPQLDFVCISHNHYDHLDTGTAGQGRAGAGPLACGDRHGSHLPSVLAKTTRL